MDLAVLHHGVAVRKLLVAPVTFIGLFLPRVQALAMRPQMVELGKLALAH